MDFFLTTRQAHTPPNFPTTVGRSVCTPTLATPPKGGVGGNSIIVKTIILSTYVQLSAQVQVHLAPAPYHLAPCTIFHLAPCTLHLAFF